MSTTRALVQDWELSGIYPPEAQFRSVLASAFLAAGNDSHRFLRIVAAEEQTAQRGANDLIVIAVARPLPVVLTLSGEAVVIDGDTLRLHGQVVRLYGIDAPEKAQRCTDEQGKLYLCGSAPPWN